MKQRLKQIFSKNEADCIAIKKWLPLVTVPLIFWQQDPWFRFSEWSWFILASSPIVISIIALSLGILILLLVLWIRSRRQRQEKETTLVVIDSETTIPVGRVDAGSETLEIESPLATDTLEATHLTPTLETEPITVPVSGQRPANIKWQIAGITDVGLKRDLNEDNFLMIEEMMAEATPYGLYLVADGLGGHQGGEIASQLTVDAIQEYVSQRPLTPEHTIFDDWLKAAVMAANQAVLSHQKDRTQAKKMGSTLVIALIMDRQAHIANVGDSRLYHLNQTGIQQISIDHSLVERLVQIGQLTREEARIHKNRNVIYNTIGDKPDPEIGLYHISLQPKDRLLLCSDGLSGMVSDQEILEISHSHPDPAKACQAMVKAAKSAGGSDNITVIIAEMDPE